MGGGTDSGGPQNSPLSGGSLFSALGGGLSSGLTGAGKSVAGAQTPVGGVSAPQSPIGTGQYPPILIPSTPITPLGNSLEALYGIYSQLL
jgi:hypothetical protein